MFLKSISVLAILGVLLTGTTASAGLLDKLKKNEKKDNKDPGKHDTDCGSETCGTVWIAFKRVFAPKKPVVMGQKLEGKMNCQTAQCFSKAELAKPGDFKLKKGRDICDGEKNYRLQREAFCGHNSKNAVNPYWIASNPDLGTDECRYYLLLVAAEQAEEAMPKAIDPVKSDAVNLGGRLYELEKGCPSPIELGKSDVFGSWNRLSIEVMRKERRDLEKDYCESVHPVQLSSN